jgi:GNAT superfamily N-acetyltransferase
MRIRPATIADADELYRLASETPEFKCSDEHPFAEQEEFRSWITAEESVFLVAEEDHILGFAYASVEKEDKRRLRWAVLNYIMVLPEERKRGVAGTLYDAVMDSLERRGIAYVGLWANAASAIGSFMQKRGFIPGQTYRWMDRRIEGAKPAAIIEQPASTLSL